MATTIKLSPKLKARVAAVVKGTDKSAHAFMLEAIEHETERAELRKRFVADALKAEKEFERTGLAYDADEVHAYVKALARGRKATPPKAKPWRD
jgi:predicted transcriptional regulator